MISIVLIFMGSFWERSMDIIGVKRDYDKSAWRPFADYFDRKNLIGFGNQFWDHSMAWSNKWRNKNPEEGEAFFGSTTVFVFFMDGWHFVKFLWLIHLFAAVVLFNPITNYLLIDLIILFFVFGAGHELSGMLLKRKSNSAEILPVSSIVTQSSIENLPK